MRKALATLLLASTLLHPLPARAVDVTPAQATAAETAFRDWLAALLGPAVTPAPRPIRLTPAGDHFDLAIPLRPAEPTNPAFEVTATARALPGGRWSIEGIKATTPGRFTVEIAVPADDPKAPPVKKTVTYTTNLVGQDGQITLDPSFDTPTTWTSSTKGGTVRIEGVAMPQETRFGNTSTLVTIRPAGPDRIDTLLDGSIQDYTVNASSPDLGSVQIAMKLVRANMALTGMSRTRGATIIQALATAAAPIMAASQPTPTPRIAPELLATLLAALQDFASGANFEELIEGFSTKYGDYGVTIAKIRLGLGAKSDKGLLEARMDLAADTIALPGIPLGGMEALIPTEFDIHPFVSGIGVPELSRILTATSQRRDPEPADIAALFTHGGITAGLESMSLEIGGATFTGNAKVLVAAPDQISGTAQLTAEDFDDLVEKVSTMPALAQALPLLILAKGIGKAVDDKLVWNIAYRDGKTLINNVDLNALAAGAPPNPEARKSPRKR